MGILLAFAPFIAFAVIDRVAGSLEGLVAGTVVSLALIVRDWLTAGRSPKVLEIGTAILFAGLTAYTILLKPDWSVFGVRLWVDAGLLAVVLVSMLIGKPFTIQYARESVDRGLWESPVFVRTNYVITGVWALAFAVMVVADLIMVEVPDIHPRVGIVLTVLALVGAIKFTSWYPERVAAGAAR